MNFQRFAPKKRQRPLGDRRANASEAVINAQAHDVRADVEAFPRRYSKTEVVGPNLVLAEIDEQIFELGAPVRGELHFGAAADRVTRHPRRATATMLGRATARKLNDDMAASRW